ncbi:MAG: phosphoglycerate dehydrogenase-like enzyme [Candidatus Poriferisodalaceae bacterium]|jgi:phosphoglycerate dehydrogenase-like enzyme
MSDLILSGRAGFERHRELLSTAAGPEATWLLMEDDKRLVLDSTGEEVDFDEAQPTVAWCGLDIFRSPAGRRFFKMVQLCPSLDWVQTAYAGHDAQMWFDLLDRGVTLTRAHISGVPIAEYVMGAVLRMFQDSQQWEQGRADRKWNGHVFREIDQSKWMVIGMGDIGRGIATRAAAFGANVTGVRRSPDGTEPVDQVIAPDQLDSALPEMDVVVLAVPATSSTDHLIGEVQIALMNPRCVVVNVGRGNAIDEAALLDALNSDRLAGAVLDVFATEPLPEDNVWWTHPRVLMTPHVSSMGSGRYRRAAQVFAANLTQRRAGGHLAGVLALDDLS